MNLKCSKYCPKYNRSKFAHHSNLSFNSINAYLSRTAKLIRECVSTGAAGAQTRRSLGHHLLHPLILRLLVLCAPAVLRPRALQDAPAPADPNS